MKQALVVLTFGIAVAAFGQSPSGPPAAKATTLKQPETFTCGHAARDATQLSQSSRYSNTTAGFDLGPAPAITISSTKGASFCSSNEPFFFSTPISEGNYRITVTLGGDRDSVTTVRAEARRLMLEKVSVAANKSVTRSFDVNVRLPDFTKPDGTPARVRLKPREIGNLDWDPKLTLEFNGTNPSVRSITIEPIIEPVIYLAGDSTMVDQDVEPWASWGQMLPRFFLPGVVVANHAESGESSASFIGEQRFPKVMSLIKPGDWLFMQFAHNDQKLGPDFPTRYRQILTDFVAQTRAKGATPVIITAMNRENFDDQAHIVGTLAPYPQIAREVAAATHTALIDLNAMSKTLFEALGPEGSDHAFMKFKAGSYPGVEHDISDTTHFNSYGAYELARCIVHGIREDKLPLTRFLDPTVPEFNPAQPDPFDKFSLPYTPMQKKEDTTKVPQS